MDQPNAPQPPPPQFSNWFISRFVADYFWFIAKNVLGWTLMLLAWPVGLLVPGPGGIPIFLIGFALVTFPGKRSLTARVLHGKAMNLRHRRFAWLTLLMAAALPSIAFWGGQFKHYTWAEWLTEHHWTLVGIYVVAFGVSWVLAKVALRLVNLGIHYVPALRRRVRPWLRHHGIDLLPPRRRKRLGHYPGQQPKPDEEILEIHERHHQRLKDLWNAIKPYTKKGIGVAFAGVVFAWLIRRVTQHWHEISPNVDKISLHEAVIASFMFAIFLVGFRMITWWRLLAGFGYRLPFKPALRIWTTSELARYVGSGISQMLGRVYLCKPYGVDSGSVSASQILELILFLLANILVGVGCMAKLGMKIQGAALTWFYVACALVPLLLATLHPKIFYGLLNRVLRKLGKQEVQRQLPASTLFSLLLWNVLGLFFQGFAIWLLTHKPLGLKPQHWWIVTGAYCLAWMAGFIAVWANAGIGVREPVFVLAAGIALPTSVRESLQNPKGLLMFLSILLRLWATVGELMLATVAYFLDYRGAISPPDNNQSTPGQNAAQRSVAPDSSIPQSANPPQHFQFHQ